MFLQQNFNPTGQQIHWYQNFQPVKDIFQGLFGSIKGSGRKDTCEAIAKQFFESIEADDETKAYTTEACKVAIGYVKEKHPNLLDQEIECRVKSYGFIQRFKLLFL